MLLLARPGTESFQFERLLEVHYGVRTAERSPGAIQSW